MNSSKDNQIQSNVLNIESSSLTPLDDSPAAPASTENKESDK